MGTFNFSNMQQQEDKMRNVPEEFRGAVESAASEPVGSYGNDKDEINTTTGFLDETGTWNNGTGQDLQKYNPTQKQFNNSIAGQMFNSNAYKKYFYSREDVLQEAKTISAATHIPENAILSNAENLKNARDIYNYQQRAMDPQAVFKAYPELGELAQKSDTDAAIALHNLKNVRQTQGIIEAAKTGWELDSLMSERGRIGYAAMNGKELTEENLKRLEEIKKQQEQAKELPAIFEDPMGAVVGGTVQSGKMMLRNALSGQKMGVYGAGFGALAGALIGGGSTLGAGTGAGAAAGAKIGYSVGSRIGMAQDMYDEIAGNNYLDYKGYKDKSGKQLLTDNQARTYAAAAAAVETGIEFTNANKILGIVKGGAGAQSLKNIIASAKDSTELQSLLAAYVRNGMKNIGEVTLSESAEEGVQEMSNRIITNFAASNNPGGDIPTYSAKDVIMGGLEASWQALPTSLGFGASAHAASTVSYARRMAAAMELKSEEDRANLRTANGISMLRSLADDIKSNELFKKSPEIYRDILGSQLKGTELENVNIDVELVLNQEGGYELLKTVADKAGMSEEQFNNVVETKADIKIDTATYVEKLLPSDIGAKLEEYITFDDIGECLARNRQYASRMRREMDKILAFEERQREDALNTFLDKNFPDKEQREVAESVIRRFPDKPAEGVKEIRKALQEKIDAPLREIIEQLKAGAGKGVSIVAVDADGKPTSWEYSDHGRGVRVSNNAPWYRKWFKEHGRAPSEREYRDLAYDIYIGDNYYGLEGWENDSPEEEQWYAENKAAIEATEQAIARLNTIAPRLEKIDPGELTITKGLSEEAFEVYKELRGQLERAESKEARQAAQMNAILFARLADRMAEWHRQAGQTKYTAKDFARSVGVEFGGKAAGQKFNQAISNPNISLDTKVPFIEIEDVFKGQKWWEARDKFPKEIINELITAVSQDVHEPVINESTGFKVVVSKKGSVEHTLSSETSTTKKGTDEAKGRGEKYNNPRHDIDHYNLVPALIKIIKKSVFVEEHPDKHGKALSVYRLYCPIKVGDRKIIAKLTLKKVKTFYRLVDGTFSDILAYDTSIVKKIEDEGPRPQKVADESVSHEGSYLTSSSISIRDMLTDVNDNEAKPFINEDGTGNFSIIDKNGTHDFSGMSGTQYTDTFNQKAYHGSGAVFDKFDLGYLGKGTGNIMHGWGLYFAKNKRIAETYKKEVSKKDGTQASLYEVEVPDNKHLLDEQKTFGEQPKSVQKNFVEAIKNLDDEQMKLFWSKLLNFKFGAFDKDYRVRQEIKSLNNLANTTIEELPDTGAPKFIQNMRRRNLLSRGYTEEQIERLITDADYRKQEQEKIRAKAESLKSEEEKAEAEDNAGKEKIIQQAQADPLAELSNYANRQHFTGEKNYQALAYALGNKDYEWRLASEYLNRYGVKGITYDGGEEGRCFVVFDDKAVDIIERYNQSAGERAMTANAEKLKEAKAMVAKAEAAEEKPDMKDIYQKTGWHLGADGKWRFEIPDNLDEIDAAKFPEEGYAIPLGEIYNNPKLYEAYPWLADVMVQSEPMEEQTLGVAAGEGYIAINSNMLGDGIKQEITINGIKYKRVVSKDGTKAGKFFSHGDEFVEYALNHGIKGSAFDKKAAVNSLKELIQEKESVIEKLRSKNNNGQFNKGILDRQKELNKLRGAAEFVGRADISFNEIKKADRDVEAAHKNLAETLIHEIQHVIQHFEGFASGGSVRKVNEQMEHQLLKYDEEIKRIHPKAWEYQKALLEYDIADWAHDVEEVSDEEFQERKDKIAELEEQIPEDKVKRIKKIYELRADLQWKAENEDATPFANYNDLHGEQEARAASMKARLYTMGASQERIDNEVLNGVDSASAIIVFAGQSYSMDAGQKGLYKIKGQTAFKANGKKVIALFKAADQSTFMHEMAHVYLHDMLELAKLPNAPKQLLDDVKTLSEWASWRPETFDKEYKGTALEREFRKMHEQIADATKYGYLVLDGKEVTLEQLKLQWAQERFARGFENYLREGKAPTESVKTIFRRFKEWLGTIYKAFVQIGGAPSKEVRAVMDRMIASEEEIDIAMSKKGVDSFTDAGGMEYLEGNAKQIYMRMVERAKAEAKEKVLKIALKDVKEDYRKQEKEFFAQEEAEYREKLQAEPVFAVQEHIKNNPDLSTSAVCETLGMSVEDYVAKLKEYGGSIDAAVKAHMREFKKSIDNSGFDAQYFREKAEALVEESKYRKLASTMELNIFEQLAKAQKKINAQSVKNMTLTNDEKGVMGTVDKLNKQSQKIEKLEAEKKEEAAKHREEKKELREKLEAEKKEGIAKHREEKEQIIANVRGLRDAALKHYQEFVDYVERKLETMPIEDANNYQMWRRKSAQAQHNSERAIVSGKWELAVKYKRAQVIYDMFADRAVRNDKKIKKIEEQLTKRRQTIIKNKNISANERYAYNHMLYVFGFVDADAPMPPKYQEENGFMGVLQKSDAPREVDGLFLECPFFTPEGFLNLPEWLVSAAMGTQQREQGHKDLSNEQVKMLAQVMNIIYKRGVDDMKLHTIESVDGKSLTVDDVIAEIEGQVNQRIVAKTIKDTTGATKKTWDEEAARAINDSNQFLIKPEVILKKLGDVSLKYIYEPLKLAADKELRMAHDMQKKMETLFKRYTPEELDEIRNKQRYKFGTSVLTKEQVIMIALNWGTEINAKRVMDGYHVGEHDVRKVLAELTERDWNLVNDIWSLYDEHWDEVREIEARITGAVLEKQPNRAFTIIGSDEKSYTLEGGYFPIKYDPSEMRTQEQKADAAAMQQTAMSNISMSLGKGFLKERSTAKIERRLDLRFDVISRSVADVIHLVAFREPVRDVRRIVLRDDFKNIVTRFLGDAEYKELKKWTADCWAEEPVAHSDIEKAIAKLRNAQTIGVMGYRVVTAALNIANAPIVAHYMGTVDMLHALKKFYSAPRQYADFIFQRSVFMAERAETMDASISDAIKEPHFMDGVPVVGKAKKYLRENAFKMLTWTDLMLAMPLWQHEYEKAYNKELEAGHTPQQAQMAGISAGDAAVRWCFGSSRTVDKARVQRKGGEFMKQLTMFYSYMSTVYNAMNYQQWEARMGYKKAVQWADANKSKELLKAIAKMGGWLFAWHLMPAIITAIFKAATSGDDDDLKPEKLLKSIGKETLSTMVGGIPALRDIVPYLLATVFDDKQFAPQLPLYRTAEQTNRVIQSIVNDKKSFTDVLRESGKLLSQTTGAPSTLVDALTTSITYLETGFDASVADYLRALILDKKLKKDKK